MTDADRSVIGGRYQIIASLGKGGMGLVYKAYDPVLDRTVALKKMIATVVDSEEGRQRFYIEARAAARLNHPNIVTIHELEEYSGDIYIVMELLDGVSLAAFMRQRVHLPLAGYLTIIAQIADGLHYAHKRAIVHRDVKPPNLVLTTSGNLKILDFGIARLASHEITRKGKLLGTPHYMAPEQVLDQSVDARADLFSLGAVAYELVTGIKPFAADSIPALLMQIASTPHRPVLEVAPQTEPALAAIIDRLLAKDRTERFLTGMEVVTALDLIGEVDRIDLVADAVSALMGPSGEMTIYAPIGSTPLPIGTPTPPSSTDAPATPASPGLPSPATLPASEDVTVSEQPFGSTRPDLPGKKSAFDLPDTLVAAPSLPPSDSPAPSAPLSVDAPAMKAPASELPETFVATPPPLPPPLPTTSRGASASNVPVAPTVPAIAPPPHVTTSANAGAASDVPAPSAHVAEPRGGSASPSVVAPFPAPPVAPPPAASAPRGFVSPGVPQAKRRSGAGAAIVVVGVLLLPAVAATGWWAFNTARGAFQKDSTTSDTTSSSAVRDADPSTQKPAESSVAMTDPAKPGETSADAASQGQEPTQTPAAVDANAATATTAPSEGADSAKPGDARQPADANQANASRANASQIADASRTAQPSQAPGANQANANPPSAAPPRANQPGASQANASPANARPANANPGDTTRADVEARDARNVTPPARDAVTDRTRETAPDTVVRDASRETSRVPGREATRRENARVTQTPREPAPPVREESPTTESSREPSTPADTRALDYGSLGAFRGGSRSTGSASSVYSDSPSTAAAVARITYTLDAYGDAIAAGDLEALREVRSPVTSAEAALLKEGRTTVRFSNLDVSLSGNDARVRCRRALVTNGKTVSSGPADVRLTRRPDGWVITEIR